MGRIGKEFQGCGKKWENFGRTWEEVGRLWGEVGLSGISWKAVERSVKAVLRSGEPVGKWEVVENMLEGVGRSCKNCDLYLN